MKKISISGAIACLMLLGLASAHAAGMGQDDMKKSNMDAKSGAMMHKSDAMKKHGAMKKDMHGTMGKGAMKKDMHGTMGKDTMQK